MILEGKTVVVTGVGSGLGSEIVRCAHRDGANVMLAARTQKNLEAVADEVAPTGERIAWKTADVTDGDACDSLFDAAIDRFGRIDALVNVAALDTVFGGIFDTPVDAWRKTFEVNVFGLATLVRSAAEHMKDPGVKGGRSIVLIGSQSSELPGPSQVAYASSKGALMTAMKFMANELGPLGIRVNTVIPTWMWGPPVQAYVRGAAKQRGVTEDEVLAEIVAKMPLGEMPADDDVAEAVVFFCSDRARMITGQSLLVNAGELMP
ncbi:MAG: SDR family oxidoreductase [Myxococcales bacterium]|nr:SDR family oxidoreductase [Myxococcales bacterium]